MAAPSIPEAPVTNAVFISVIARSVQRLEDHDEKSPARVVSWYVAVQRIGHRALYQGAHGTGNIEVRLHAVELAKLAGLGQVARARIAVHPLDLDDVHHVEAEMSVCHGDSVKRVRSAGDAVQARFGKERGKVTGEAIQLVPAIVAEIKPSLGEFPEVVILVQVGVVEGVCALQRLGWRSVSELFPGDAFSSGPLRGEQITFVVELHFNAWKQSHAVARQRILVGGVAGSAEDVICQVG